MPAGAPDVLDDLTDVLDDLTDVLDDLTDVPDDQTCAAITAARPLTSSGRPDGSGGGQGRRRRIA